jgi:hypothetical protein
MAFEFHPCKPHHPSNSRKLENASAIHARISLVYREWRSMRLSFNPYPVLRLIMRLQLFPHSTILLFRILYFYLFIVRIYCIFLSESTTPKREIIHRVEVRVTNRMAVHTHPVPSSVTRLGSRTSPAHPSNVMTVEDPTATTL